MNFYDYLKESSLSRIFKHSNTLESCYGVITAFRKEYKKINKERNAKLASDVRASGYGYFFVIGSFIENKGMSDEEKVKEYSLFIIGDKNDNGRLKGLLKKWCKKYEQESVLYKPDDDTYIYSMDETGKMDKLGQFHPNRVSDYMSELMTSKGTFTFESVNTEMNMIEKMVKDRKDGNKSDIVFSLK